MAVCRFFSASYAPKSSHFYTPYPGECASLAAGSVWQLESTAVFYLVLPDTDERQLRPAGTSPLYRLYNDTMGGAPNHRYTASRTVRDATVARGSIAEGSGPDVGVRLHADAARGLSRARATGPSTPPAAAPRDATADVRWPAVEKPL